MENLFNEEMWNSPEEFKDLSSYKYIAIDLETKDPNLKKMGSGSVRGDGAIIGVAVAVDGWSGYYSFGHEQGNFFAKEAVMKWVKDICALPCPKIFHNAMYDVCWLRSYGVKINGIIVDTMMMAAVLDENRLYYSLNSLAFLELGKVKNEKALQDAADKAGIDAKSEMYKLPASMVGAYAEMDAELTLQLFKKFSVQIKQQSLQRIFNLETNLFPMLVDMKFKGVRVDVDKAHRLKGVLEKREAQCLAKVKQVTGVETQIWAARSIAKVFDKLGLPYSRTAKSNSPSFTKATLENHENPVVKNIAEARELNKAHTTFIDTILKHEHNGRIHADINQLRSDAGGTVTGRFSYSNPNLQQIPSRNNLLGPAVRGLFIPEQDCDWGCFDYSQQEPRLVLHYAAEHPILKNSESVVEMVSKFNKDPKMDFHRMVANLANIERKQAKTINLGLFYGMGKAKLQQSLDLENKEDADQLFNNYHDSVPFVKGLMDATMRDAQKDGEIQTIAGRVCRFDKWEEARFAPGELRAPMTYEEARGKYGEDRIRRAFTYKALNKLIQGSAADMTKQAMLDLYEEGITPHIQVHDELDISVESEHQAQKIIAIMQDAVKLVVRNKVDYEKGPTWGDVK
jgi:DNA polymerase I-like protein with 3'-5' exonuclease and polymerase domains